MAKSKPLSMRHRAFWRNLTKNERRELMALQTSRSYGARSAYLPDDCSECGACGEPVFGSGWCAYCWRRYDALMAKGRGVSPERSGGATDRSGDAPAGR